ncbi:P-loop containing nucleoside triphosphate hydrolase protein [Cryphonectria parasitica EP155]|uniref:P-loop containing nucleoside triphosphate hydrolase protein n=1 Tax=Cryphonectria parasitica (strain ATCC 38755 / EP155) TaxID=660469 RepID=A0A9P4YCW0_CRYP1|nr:P-loop containing nucleoside triphosphate hydrolase protein [Cryphonectria parasitica EP155]KAF3770669.1 P-loop containing nucleoside triphosphate hydrolase protein [Cryphonectria parasitica EP155]
MVQPKSQKNVGLGNALMHDRFGKGKGKDRRRGTNAVTRVNHTTGEEYITNEREEASWVKMRSVTEQGALDEFLATAELAGTDFTAEKMNNVKIIHTDQKNPYLLSATEERKTLKKHKENREKLTVPRRPKWDENTTPEELDALERESFLNWRRGLAELQENNDLLMTPFERNLEVWRQLWRVIERSELVVQIVDARNPLMFRSEDLEHYVKDVDQRKENLLLINKADMMTYKQRKAWANYLKGAKIAYRFFSAQLAKEYNELREEDEGEEEDEEEDDQAPPSSSRAAEDEAEEEDGDVDKAAQDGDAPVSEEDDEDTRIMTVEELESIFLQHAPANSSADHKITIGLVGYPNVGKSSTINALVGAKKVSVSSTPGKTKHFQTIHLSDRVVLCDCPGLVFPNFATTKAELVCNGVLPIDQLREFTGPGALVAKRIPKSFLEALYGITIHMRPLEEGGTGVPTSQELLRAYARARGFATTGQGNPDESRAARYILKDYVNGKLLWVEPPPGDIDAKEFNGELYDPSHLTGKRRLALAAAMEAMSVAGGEDDSEFGDLDMASLQPAGAKSKTLDKNFFGPGSGNAGHLGRPFSYKYTQQGKVATAATGGKHLSGRKARAMIALENGLDPKDVQLSMSGKKHFKGGQKAKGKKQTDKLDDDF